MSTTTIQATINDVDIPLLQALFNKFKINLTVLKEKDKKEKTYPIETAIPNKETQEAIQESDLLIEQYEKGLIKGYTNVKQMLEDIDNE